MINRAIIKIFFAIALIVLCVAAIVGFCSITSDLEVVLTEKQCKNLLLKTPEEFVEDPYPDDPYIDWTGGVFCESASIDESGNLIFTLTPEQQDVWVYCIQHRLDRAKNNPNVTLSPNYREISVRCYEETAYKNVHDASFASYGYLVIQLVNGVSPDEIKVDITFIDSGTGEVVYVRTSNLNQTGFYYSKNDFSSMPE